MKAEDLTGKRFGAWLVLGISTVRKNGHIYWRCLCSCGKENSVLGEALRNGNSTRCWSCGRISAKKKIRKNINDRYRELKYNYGLSNDKVQELLRAQDFKCNICLVPINERAIVDHSHQCCSGQKTCGKCIRGFLCRKCNSGLGMFSDSLEIILRAARYLGGII